MKHRFQNYIKRYLRELSLTSAEKASRLFKKCSFSQCGEDVLIEYIFHLRGIHQPSYIDIGANHPFFLSNTAMFYEKGCRGINIEANPELITLFEKHRSQDINLNIGISDTVGELEFYIMEDNTLSTFSKEECELMISKGKNLSQVKNIKLNTVAYVLEKFFQGKFPDFMSLDVEGFDFKILQSIDFEKSFPKIICVEAAEYSPIGAGARRGDLIDFLGSKGYYEYANTNLNAIMVKKEFWFI
jgi:FkbM family methyltransferase